MILKRNAFKNDVLKLSDIDIVALKDGKTLSVDGLEVVHIASGDYIKTALQSLVDLKTYKDVHGKDDYYLKTQPLLWEAAHKVLNITERDPNHSEK